MQLATSQPLGLSILALVQALAALVLAFRTNWKLTLVVLSIVPVIVVGISFISRHGHRYISGHNDKLNQAMRSANNFITNIVLVKCFNTQDQETRKYALAIEEAAQLSLKSSIFRALQSGFVRFASTVIFVQGKYAPTAVESLLIIDHRVLVRWDTSPCWKDRRWRRRDDILGLSHSSKVIRGHTPTKFPACGGSDGSTVSSSGVEAHQQSKETDIESERPVAAVL